MAGNNLIVDLTNYKDKVGARIPEGTYKVIVDDVEMDQSKAGNPMINMWLRVHGGDHDGATITDRLVLTDKSMFRVVGFLQAIGIPTPKKRLSLDITKFVGRALEVSVRDGAPYNGRVKSEVAGYARLPKAAATQSEDDIEDVAEESPAEAVAEAEAPAKPAPEAAKETESPWGDGDQGEVDLDELSDL